MLRAYFASMRIGFALVCVGISLVLGGQWLGFLPDVTVVRAKAQQDFCEAVSVSVAAAVQHERWTDLDVTLRTLVNHNEELLSVGVRTEHGKLRLDTGHHDTFWLADSSRARAESQPAPAKNKADARHAEFTKGAVTPSTKTSGTALTEIDRAQKTHTVEVPMTLNRHPWGTVEFSFAGDRSSVSSVLANHSLLPFVCFFCVSGWFSYSFVMARIMGVFRNTQVVPDRVRRALDTLAEGLLVLDDQGRIVLANQAFSNITGIPSDDLAGRDADELKWQLPSENTDGPSPWRIAIKTAEVQTGSIVRYTLSSGEVRIFSVNSAPLGDENDRRGALVTFRDVTHIETHRAEQDKMLAMLRSSRDQIHRKNRELELLATEDSLTGCLNRRAFFERFENFWNSAQEQNTPLACFMFDIDQFKAVNDTYGHHIGDEVLRKVAKAIRDNHEKDHLVCRYGGEEFCIVLPMCDLEAAREAAEKTRRAIMDIRFSDPAELRMTASIGVSELKFNAEDPQAMINQADSCLFLAKKQGRNRVVTYEVGLEDLADQPQSRDESKPDTRDLVAIPFQAVTALLGALSFRDSDTAEHSCRVADLCVRVAEGLLPKREVYTLEVASLLHDIGKIGVPDHVLLKPGKLTDDEWKLMRKHDEIGVSIIDGTFGSPDLQAIVQGHHARYEGDGDREEMPSGKDIPRGARILAIADSYDAMVSDRVYRKGRCHDEAVLELRRCSGTQFDPDWVEEFIRKINPKFAPVQYEECGLTKQVALRIGIQIELIANAIDGRDTEQLRHLVVRLGSYAKTHRIESISRTAEAIEKNAVESLERKQRDETCDEDDRWLEMLRKTNELLEQCRSTQSVYVGDSSDRNRRVIESLMGTITEKT